MLIHENAYSWGLFMGHLFILWRGKEFTNASVIGVNKSRHCSHSESIVSSANW